MAQSSNRLKLTRSQLAAFLKDPEAIRQFEKLFAVADQELPSITILIEAAQTSADGASAAANQAAGLAESLRQLSELAAFAPAPQPPVRKRKGSLSSSATQTAAATATAYAVTFNTVQVSDGVEIGSPASRVVVDTEGTYLVCSTLQVEKTSAGPGTVFAWWRLNGANIANSTRSRVVNGTDDDGQLVLSSVLSLKAGDYVEVVWEVDSTAIQLTASVATGVHPATPSAQLSVWPV